MTRDGAPPRARTPRPPRDPYGIGPVAGYIGPIVAVVALVLIGAFTLSLMNGDIPFVHTSSNGGDNGNGDNGNGDNGNGPTPSPAPSNVVIVPPAVVFPGSIVYAKAGNIWIQTGKEAHQLTTTGLDAMPTFSADGQWIYFIRVHTSGEKFPTGGFGPPSYYDNQTPNLVRMRTDGSNPTALLTGRFTQGTNTWFYWLRQPVPSPNGKTIAVISDGPNPLQGDITLHTFGIASKKLTSLNLPESLHLGHQDPAWRPDGKAIVYVENGRDGTRGAPQIVRYDLATQKTHILTGPGYLAPSYSPDGSWIAATKTGAFGTDIAILDATGKEVARITDDGHSFSPVWSPAGNAIAFLHLAGTIVDLRMVTLDESTGNWVVSATVDLTKVSGLDGASRPSWYVPPSELPAASPPPGAGGSPSASTGP
jgi:Tol biopolymer transport system component